MRIICLIKKISGWIAAFVIAAVLCNLACFLFYDPCQELPRDMGSTTGFLLPGRGAERLHGRGEDETRLGDTAAGTVHDRRDL